MDVESVSGLDMAAAEKGFAFLKQEVVGIWGQDCFFQGITNDLFDHLGLQNASADSGQVDAEERFLIREHPMLEEVGSRDVLPELHLAETECFGKRLNAGANHGLQVFGFGQRSCQGEEIQVPGQSRALVEKDEGGASE